MKLQTYSIHIAFEEFFQFALITYLILLLTETVQTGFVSNFFNLNILLGVVLTSGIIMLITQNKEVESALSSNRNIGTGIQNSLLLSIGAGLLVFYKTLSLGKIAIVIAIISMGLTFLLSILVLMDNQEAKAVEATDQSANQVVAQPLLPYVHESKVKAAAEQQTIRDISGVLKKQYQNTPFYDLYVDKVRPYEEMILNTLSLLRDDLEGDAKHNKILEDIAMKQQLLNESQGEEAKAFIHQEITILKLNKGTTERGKHEKILELYKDTLVFRSRQLHESAKQTTA